MTNEEAKLQAIKNAYGKHWDKVKKYVTKDGWIANKYLGFSDFVLYEPFHKEGYWDDDLKQFEAKFRPVSLSGIENNNGWIRINSVDDLPKDFAQYWFVPCGFFEEPFIGQIDFESEEVFFVDKSNFSLIKEVKYGINIRVNAWLISQITHFQPITKPKQPIY